MTESPRSVCAYRGRLLHFLADPGDGHDEHAVQFLEDGLLVVEDGLVKAAGTATELLPTLDPDASVVDYSGRLLLPGFVDTHIHYPQTDIIASYGTQLLDWLERYAFPGETRFADAVHAAEVAEFFLDGCCAMAPPPRWCSPPCTRIRSTSSSLPWRATCEWSPARS
jgi:guanine deaminase